MFPDMVYLSGNNKAHSLCDAAADSMLHRGLFDLHQDNDIIQ